MDTDDKSSSQAQEMKGKIEEKLGAVTGDEHLEDEGKTDQVESAINGVGEKVKEAASKIKHIVADD